MRRTTALVVIVVGLAAVAIANPASAQTRPPVPRRPQPTDRIFISVDGMYQAGSENFTDSATFPANAETATFNSAYDVKPGPAFSIAGSGLVWRQLAIGIGVSRFSRETPTAVTASIPHPFFFNQPRSLTEDIAGFHREELAVHVQARAMVPMSNRHMQTMVYGGPSFFSVKQDVLNRVGYSETYPYDSITPAPGQTASVSKSKVGFNAGADVAYFFTRQVGVGGTAQYAGTTMALSSASGGTVDVKVGGFQAGGGLRLRF
ncbi:MAG TPA: hypothetical protein VKB50_29880 [Vicinamibacterales bacterium]|nr:hypothetical protein [Vicinamibacterales bacterium]